MSFQKRAGKSIHHEEVATNTGKPFATKQLEQFTPSLSSSSTTVMAIDHRKWNDILAAGYIDEQTILQDLEDAPSTTTSQRS